MGIYYSLDPRLSFHFYITVRRTYDRYKSENSAWDRSLGIYVFIAAI